MKRNAKKTLLERGKLFVRQQLNGVWNLCAMDAEDEQAANSEYLSESQLKEVCSIVNKWSLLKRDFLEALDGIRQVTEAAKDSITKENHLAIDLLLLLIDKKIEHFKSIEKDAS